MPELLATLSTILIIFPLHLNAHGRLIEPPSRASAWRYGFSTPPDYNDHELYCGGLSRQWRKNGGKCGICGDAWDLPPPRPHELGGVYGQGMIVRRYTPKQLMTIRVELTANHFGHFEFRLCDNYKNTTQDCLDKNLLKMGGLKQRNSFVSDEDGYKFYPKDGNKIYEMRYRLPNITCNHCILQWIYISANNWGTCLNGSEAIGCGPQEEFRACADISINPTYPYTPSIPLTTPQIVFKPTELPPADKPAAYQRFTTLVVISMALLLVLVFLGILFVYFYEVGKRVKTWIKFGKSKKTVAIDIPPPPKGRAPLPPPRAKRSLATTECKTYNKDVMYDISLGNESLA